MWSTRSQLVFWRRESLWPNIKSQHSGRTSLPGCVLSNDLNKVMAG
jgi:hypothetical protein